MSTSAPNLIDAASAVAAWLDASGVRGAVIGGVAVSALARPRTTRDVDALVWLPQLDAWPAFVGAMSAHGLAFRTGGSLEFAYASRVLLLEHARSHTNVDVSFGALPFEEELVLSARVEPTSGLALPLPRPDDVIVLKAVAARPQDYIDIVSLLECHPSVDRRRVHTIVAAMADALDAPELVDELDRLFARVPMR